jgi:hypothetical protein
VEPPGRLWAAAWEAAPALSAAAAAASRTPLAAAGEDLGEATGWRLNAVTEARRSTESSVDASIKSSPSCTHTHTHHINQGKGEGEEQYLL